MPRTTTTSRRFLFAEALEHLDEVEGLSDEGRGRLEEFAAELAELRAEARRPVPDFLAEVARRIGLLAELDADPDAERAAGIRRNLAAFLDEVHAFSPLEGELTLRAFLDYVQLVEASDRQEWSPVQPSSADSVKVMTIHQAKGLEFDTVFVPGLAQGILPDLTIQHNPAERGKSIDFELRGDAAILPAFDGNLSKFKDALREQELIEERRTCYVALTRARRRLFASAAHWYGDDVQKPKPPGQFLEELAEWAHETGLAAADLGAEPPEENPLVGYRERFVRDWPGPALPPGGDDLFPEGWRRAALDASEDPASLAHAVGALEPAEWEAYERASSEGRLIAAAPARARGRAGSPAGGADGRLGRRPHRLRAVPQALLLDHRAAAAPVQRPGGPDRHPHPRLDRAAGRRPDRAVRGRRPARLRSRGAGGGAGQDRTAPAGVPREPVRRVPAAVRRAPVPVVEGRVRAQRAHRRDLREPGRAVGGRRLQDRPKARRGRRAGRAPARHLCARLHRGLGEAPRGPHADLSVPGVGRRGQPAGRARGRFANASASGCAASARVQFEPTPGDQCRWCDFLPFCDAGRAFQANRRRRGRLPASGVRAFAGGSGSRRPPRSRRPAGRRP